MESGNRGRRQRQGDAATEAGAVLYVHKTLLEKKTEKGRKDTQETIAVRKFETEPAYVRVSAGTTKNLGNYESLRVEVSLSVPCYTEEIDEVFPQVADKVAAYLTDEIKNYDDF